MSFGSIRRAFGSLSRSSRASLASSFTPSTTGTTTPDSASIMTTATSVNTSGSITLRGTGEFEEVSFDTTKEMLVMASLKAPVFEQNPEDKRAPIDVCCVIDRSGSMAGDKLNLAKKAMLFVLDNLDTDDSLSVVLYDTSVDTLFNFMKMDKKGKAKAKEAIEKVATADCTNLCGGLIRGLELVNSRSSPSDISSVLLFTDGLANEGLTATPEITAAMEKKLAETDKKPSVFSFGFGSDHNEQMLRAIAEAGGGMYYYVADTDNIPVSFADCLGGLQSVVAQKLSLQIEGAKDVKVLKSLNAKYRVSRGTLPGSYISVELGDLYSEEERDVIFLIELPKLEEANEDEAECVSFSVGFFNVLSGKEEGISSPVKVRRPAKVTKEQKSNETLDKQRNRLTAAEAMQNSRALADKGDMSGAQKVIRESKSVIEQSSSSRDTYCQNLMQELDECVTDMSSRDHYMSKGSKVISRKEQAHYYQRSNKLEDAEISFYETSSKKASKTKAKGFF